MKYTVKVGKMDMKAYLLSDIDNGVRNGMCINYIIICWSVHDTEMTMKEVVFAYQCVLTAINRPYTLETFEF
jgi:hypothetical protein